MIAIISLLVIISLSILITRVATIALAHTGLSEETARFQARSAFTGSGFTTDEAERVVKHPVRRRIIMLLMLLGNAGIVTAVSSLILAFVNQGNPELLAIKITLLVAGIVTLWAIASSQWVDRHLARLINQALKRYTQLEIKDYADLIHLAGDYRLVELQVRPHDWIANKTLAESSLWEEGIVVLGIERPDGTYLGAPVGTTKILPGEILILYGRISALKEIDKRKNDKKGDREHQAAVAKQKRIIQ
ncbi:TrkA-C domain protein [Nitrosococcus halophilus Nc 4]|uniref:TrkA-C domain protein n=1 Tax=Nitrosococcus halophilus (strain Nc4) TaxID=472759 RepID=D5C217_NITHN|nr:TrkA C-terminal domain-containing protein [Nitrosococcus halophilus]ADE16605.1 TrkA-C domain protein [Nitrosococcus halophilus Nc 4]